MTANYTCRDCIYIQQYKKGSPIKHCRKTNLATHELSNACKNFTPNAVQAVDHDIGFDPKNTIFIPRKLLEENERKYSS